MSRLRALITAGPTREHLDPVRYLSNGSSGKMGLEIASALKKSGCDVSLILGPGVEPFQGIACDRVISAVDMLKAVSKKFGSSDLFVSCAAVSDFRPKTISRKKIKKGSGGLMLELVPNPDILFLMGKRKKNQFVVGFALEDADGARRAEKKLRDKHCDMIVLNGPETIDSQKINPVILCADGTRLKLGKISKKVFAEKLCREILKRAVRK